GYVDAKKNIDLGKMPLTIKAGARVYDETRDNRRVPITYTFVGADGVANTADDNAGAFKDTNYSGEDPYWGSRPIEWISAYQLAEAFKANPAWFTRNAITNETDRINNSERITERVTAGYVQLEGKLLNNRLQFVTGVRYEKTRDRGEGVLVDPDIVWQRNANGTFVDSNLTLAGVQRVLRTDIGALNANGTANSVQAVQAIRQERGYKADRSYDDYYPSLNVTYNLTDNLIVRLGYAKTMGRPDYVNIIPLTTIDDNENFDFDPTVSPGSLTIRNTGLKPWSADNYDLSLEYYFGKGGLITAGVFQKSIQDFFLDRSGTVDAALAEELGVGPEFIGWGVNTRINGPGTAKITGGEFSFNRQLDFLPGPLRFLSINANATRLRLEGPSASAFAGFIPKTGNIGISWNKKPISAKLNFNYRGRQQRGAQTGAQYGAANGFFEYYKSRVNVDVNFEYTFSKRVKIFANARNIFNEPQILQRYSETVDSPARTENYQQEEFGIQ
ncbi:MAG: TonB-dependent receptor, partial [Vicinamibacterales bacterium]